MDLKKKRILKLRTFLNRNKERPSRKVDYQI